MQKDVEEKIKNCERCIRKGKGVQKAPMNSISTSYPLELLSVDFLTVEVKGKKQNILVILDHFTKFAQAILTTDQKAKTVAKALWDGFFLTYGFPRRLLTDQGRDFESNLIKELCNLAGIKKCRTTPYHPSGNPVERLNRTLIERLRSLSVKDKDDWRKKIKLVIHAYNCCIHSSTGFSPYFLFYGRQPILPVELAFGVNTGVQMECCDYVKRIKNNMKLAYAEAKNEMNRAGLRNKKRYDVNAHGGQLEEGDRVLVRKVGNTNKVDDKWIEGVYVVLSKRNDSPVYTVRCLDTNIERTVHRNLLLPIGWIGVDNIDILDNEQSLDVNQQAEFDSDDDSEKVLQENQEIDFDDNDDDSDDSVQDRAQWAVRYTAEIVDSEFNSTAITENEEVINDNVDFDLTSEIEAEEEVASSDNEESNISTTSNDIETSNTSVELEQATVSDEQEGEEEEVVVLRRSKRQKRPVERLNLTHMVKKPDTCNNFPCWEYMGLF